MSRVTSVTFRSGHEKEGGLRIGSRPKKTQDERTIRCRPEEISTLNGSGRERKNWHPPFPEEKGRHLGRDRRKWNVLHSHPVGEVVRGVGCFSDKGKGHRDSTPTPPPPPFNRCPSLLFSFLLTLSLLKIFRRPRTPKRGSWDPVESGLDRHSSVTPSLVLHPSGSLRTLPVVRLTGGGRRGKRPSVRGSGSTVSGDT